MNAHSKKPDFIAPLPIALTAPLIQRALAEDFGDAGDLTSQSCIPEDRQMTATIVARKAGSLSGVALAATVFTSVDQATDCRIILDDGYAVQPGDAVVRLSGPARSILMAERVALNFLGHLSGIASATAALVAETEGTRTKIVCTRKTTPGLRAIEKFAVRCGGGLNHRFGLYDAVMIKDNHIAASGSIKGALTDVRRSIGHTVKVEIEVDTLDQLNQVLACPADICADIILLDNMTNEQLRQAVARNREHKNNHAILEASGNVTVESVAAIAATGVDYISSGWITHSAPVLDLGLDVT